VLGVVMYCSEDPESYTGLGGDNAHTSDNFTLVATNQKIRSKQSCAVNTRQEPGKRLTFLGRGLSRASANNSECASTNPKHNGSEARRSVVRGRIAGSAGRRSYRTAQRMRAGVMWGALSRLCTVQETLLGC
jgi:hypothetical protein